MKQIFTFLFITLLISLGAVSSAEAQVTEPTTTNAKPTPTPDEATKKFQEKLTALARSAGNEANSLGLPENRVGFTIETAAMLWNFDEKASRELFQTAMNDLRNLFAEANNAALVSEDSQAPGDYVSAMETIGKGRKALAMRNLRRQLVLSWAKYDAESAYNFLLETRPVEKPKNQEYYYDYQPPDEETSLELQIAQMVAENDTSRSLEIAIKSLDKGFNYQLSSTLEKLSRKDAAKGAKLATAIIKKLGSTDLKTDRAASEMAFSLLRTGASGLEAKDKVETNGKKKTPILTEAQMRELAEILTKLGIGAKMNNDTRYSIFPNLESAMPILIKYAPNSAAQLQLKIKQANAKAEAVSDDGEVDVSVNVKETSRSVVTGTAVDVANKKEQAKQAEKAELEGLYKRAGSSDEKVSVDEIRASVSKIKGRSQKFMMLAQMAYTLGQNGKTKEAKEILGDAERMTAPQAKKAAEMLEALALIRAYSVVEPDKAFQLLETMIYELNDVINGFVKVANFAVGEMIMANGEIDLTGFGSEFLGSRGLGGLASMGLNEILVNLAKADFDRTASLSDKFERPEVRLTAKMIVLRSLMPQSQKAEEAVEYQRGAANF